MATVLRDLILSEISMVDHPANPGAKVLLMKRAPVEEPGSGSGRAMTFGEARKRLVEEEQKKRAGQQPSEKVVAITRVDTDPLLAIARSLALVEEAAARQEPTAAAYPEIRRRAQQLVDLGKASTIEQGVVAVLKQDRTLYQQHVAEHQGPNTEARTAYAKALHETEIRPLLKVQEKKGLLKGAEARAKVYGAAPGLYSAHRVAVDAAAQGASVAALERGHVQRADMVKRLCVAVSAVQGAESLSLRECVSKALGEPGQESLRQEVRGSTTNTKSSHQVHAEIRRRAEQLVRKGEAPTIEQGAALVVKRDPALYRAHVAESRGGDDGSEAA